MISPTIDLIDNQDTLANDIVDSLASRFFTIKSEMHGIAAA